MQIFGVVLGALSLVLVAVSLFALIQAGDIAELLGWAAAAGEPVNPVLWKQHWIAYTSAWAVFSLLLLAAAVAVVHRRRWGLALWATLTTAGLLALLLHTRLR